MEINLLSNIHDVLALHLLEHKFLAFTHDEELPHRADTHGVRRLRRPRGAGEAGVVVSVQPSCESVHQSDRTLGCADISISQILQYWC